ncbi:MAG: DNA polymerase I, partial [Clostridia bacterium]|nr:DNA polymerase I [Clostridia bacterium]
MERIVIIDGNSLINRAYYAMQKPMITKDGIYTQGIYGFLNMLSKIMKDYSPEYLTVAFDRKAPTFRHEAFEGYKAGRKGMPPELAMEMPILKDILHAMNIKTLEMDGFEADDIIGTVSRVAEEEGLEPLIVTGDRDSFQLCTHIAKVIYTKKGVTEFDLFDHDKMLEVYNCTPKQFIDLKGLMGDKSDNIPGLPGVGEKTAMKLLEQFGSVEELIVHSDEIENEKLRNKVQENEQMAMMSKKLATINVFTPIDFEISDFKVVDYNYDELIEIYRKLEFNKFLKELELEEVKEDVVNVDFEVLKPSNLDFLDELKDKELMIKVFSNNSHVSKPELYAVAFLCEDKLYYLDKFDGLDSKISELKLIGHGLKDQLYDLMSLGCKEFNAVFDAEIAAYLINPTKSDYSFEALCNENLLGDIIKEKDILDGNEQISLFFDPSEAYISYLKEYFNKLKVLVERLKKELEKEDLFKIFQELEMPLVEV